MRVLVLALLVSTPALAQDAVAVVWSPVPGVVVAAADSSSIDAFLEGAPLEGTARGVVIATGQASFYGERFRGRRTANGERFNPDAMTAAHRTLPFGTRLRVTNTRNGRSVLVRVNDRGPFTRGRVLDLSRAAAREIGMIRSGTARVRIERL
ncbi:MAG: septal ring lytic transglycosylase RlpA family protein [Rubrivirga sp.]